MILIPSLAWAQLDNPGDPGGVALNNPTNFTGPPSFFWSMVGPGAGGAFNQAMETGEGALLIGGDVGGLFRSLNKGQSWLSLGKLNSSDPAGGNSTIFDRTNCSAFAFDNRLDSSVVYMGIEGAILRSTNAGRTFHARMCDSTTGTDWIHSIDVCRWHPDTVLCSWNANSSDHANSTIRYNVSRGLVDTASAGQIWRRVANDGLPQTDRYIKIRCKPNNAQFIYALSGTDGQVNASSFGSSPRSFRLYRKRGSAGTRFESGSWTDISPGGSADSVMDFLIHPEHPDTIFATTWTGALGNAHTGQTWVRVNQDSAWRPISAHTGVLLCAKRGPALEPLIFTIDAIRDYSPSCTECGAWKNPNAAAQQSAPISDGAFTRVNTGLNDTGWQFMQKWAYGKSERGLAGSLVTSAADSITFYWCTSEYVFRGDTTGAFTNIFTDLKRPGPKAGNDYWTGRSIGNTIPVSASAAAGITAIGWYDLGIGLSRDGGITWQMSNDSSMTAGAGGWLGHGGDCSAILIDPARPTTIWAGQGTGKTNQTLIKSTSSGVPGSWSQQTGLASQFIYALALDKTSPVGSRKMYACGNGDLFRSTDDGVTWNKVWDRAAVQDSGLCAVGVQGNTVLVGGANGLWRSSDGGADSSHFTEIFPMPSGWTIQTAGQRYDVRHRGVHDIQFGATNEVFVTISGSSDAASGHEQFVNAAGDSFGTYRSTDGGVTWAKVHAGGASGIGNYEDHFHLCRDGSWWVGSRSVGAGGGLTRGNGIWRSKSRGSKWDNVTADMPWPSVGAIVSDPVDASWIIATALGPGAFRARLPGLWAPSRDGGSSP